MTLLNKIKDICKNLNFFAGLQILKPHLLKVNSDLKFLSVMDLRVLRDAIIFIIYFIFLSTCGNSQNLFDENNVLKFANFLFSTHQYKFASEEFERLVLLNPDEFVYKLDLVRSYRLGENFVQSEKRIEDFAGDSLNVLTGPLAKEYLNVKLLQENFSEAQKYLSLNNRLDLKTKNKYSEYICLLGKNWSMADTINNRFHPLDIRYDKLLADAGKITNKSPFISGALSTIVPGLGKAYSGYWKDGAIALVFVSVNAWQSYRGFSKFGIHNGNGWIFGSLAVGFYLGNIYGSVKAAIKHNKAANDKIYNRAKIYIYSDFQ
jgi:hypothetical protein